MAIADVKDYQSLQRDILVRVTFAFAMNDYLTLQAGTTYRSTYALGFNIATAEENGSTVSVSNTAGAGGDLFEVTTSAAISSSNPLIGYFYLHYTSGPTVFLDRDDPTGAVSNLTEWKSGILRGLSIKDSISTVIDGRISSNSSSIALVDTALEIEDFLNYEHDDYGDFLNDISLSNQNVDIWLGLNNNFDLVFKGRIANVSFNGYNVTIALKDGLREFVSAAYCGDLESECIMKQANYANIDKNAIEGKPIRFFLGHLTPFQGKRATIANSSYSDRTVVVSSLPDAYNIDYQQAYGAAKNDKWVLGRFPSGQFNTASYTMAIVTQNRTTHGGNTWYQIWVSLADAKKCHPGMLVTVTYSDLTTAQVPVHSVSYIDSAGAPHQDNGFGWFSFVHTTNLSVTSPVTVDHSWGIVYKVTGGTWGSVIDNTNQIDQTNCTVTKTTTEAGHDLVSVELTGAVTPAAVDGETEFKFYAVCTDTVETHTMMEELVEGAGYTADATSFASSIAGKELVLAIPDTTTDTFPTYLQMISKVINSTFFNITFDTDEKVYLNNLGADIQTPPSVDYTLYEEDILDGSFSWSYITNNISPNIRITCNYFRDKVTAGELATNNRRRIFTNEEYILQKLHKTTQTKTYDSVDPNGWETFNASIQQVAYTPRRIYRFSLPMKYYDIQLGEKIVLDSSIKYVTNDRSMLVISITRSLVSVTVECYQEIN